jgi:hypothetical protein
MGPGDYHSAGAGQLWRFKNPKGNLIEGGSPLGQAEECDPPVTGARHSLPATFAYQPYRTVWRLLASPPHRHAPCSLPQPRSFHETTCQEE